MLYNIRLGDSESKVMRLAPSAIKIERSACASDYIRKHQKVVPLNDPTGHCVKKIIWRADSVIVSVTFQEDLPGHPGSSVVSDVDENWVDSSEKKQAMFVEELRDRFGSPGITDGKKPWIVALWCFGFSCRTFDPPPKLGAVLTVHKGYGANLFDNAAASARIAAANDILASHHVTLQQ